MKSRVPFEPRLGLEIVCSEADNSDIELTVKGEFRFSPIMSVSNQSVYSDSIWTWEDPSNLRLRIHSKSCLRIDWNYLLFNLNLTRKIIGDLKKYAFLRCFNSRLVFSNTKKNAHPLMVVREVRVIADFFSHMRNQLSVCGESLIDSLSDIEVQDLRDCLASYSGRKSPNLRMVLSNFGSFILGKYLSDGQLKWNRYDIETMPWNSRKTDTHGRLPEELFSFLSNSATRDVKQFLTALNFETQDKSPIVAEPNKFKESFEDFAGIFEQYVNYRNSKWYGRKGYLEYMKWITSMKRRTNEFAAFVDRARLAAQVIILMYTGARVSELAGFEIGCLRKKDDVWVILGTVIKDRDLSAPIGNDEWVAIPIVRDAVRVLQQAARVTGSKYLFHHSRPSKESSDFMRSSLIRERVLAYIELIDSEGKWKGFRVHPHQFRNSLVFEMRKAGLGLPFISYQLKHAFDAFGKTVSNTTLGYGSLGAGAVQKAIDDANLEAMFEIFHPNSPIAGGGAAQHKHRREEYFRGLALQGVNAERVLQYLVKVGGVPLTDVGLGYCQGRTKIVVDGVKTDPPCIGQLRCNPVRCQNAVIPKYKLPMWEKLAEENLRRAEDPEFAHARSELLEAAGEAESVIRFFQIERRVKNGKSSL